MKEYNCAELIRRICHRWPNSRRVMVERSLDDFEPVFEELMKSLPLQPKRPGQYEKVLRLRFGLDDGRFRTAHEVGEMMGGLGRQRILAIEQKALRYLHHPSREKLLAPFIREVDLGSN